MDGRRLAGTIVDEEAPPERVDRPVRWLLPAISVGIALVFGAVALGRTGIPTLVRQAGPAPVAAVAEPEPRQMTVITRPGLPAPPRLPADVATLVDRSRHTSVGGLISRDQLDASGVHHVYRLDDGRRLVLQQYVGELGAFPYPGQAIERIVVRGRDALALGPRGLGTAPTVWWQEGRASYRLWAPRLELDELIAIARRLGVPAMTSVTPVRVAAY